MWYSHFRYGQCAMIMNRYTNVELVNIPFIYGLTNGNGRVAVRLYGERYPTRWQPNHQTFARGVSERGSFRNMLDDTHVNFETNTHRYYYDNEMPGSSGHVHQSVSCPCLAYKNVNYSNFKPLL
ncbi:hypothetical protein TNCV_2224111 [Trichonephila clavipes]|nr:hypothetical protein TNCV_2224111 [Trichonephila clavipes]